MADFQDRNFNTAFSGLSTTVAIMGAVGVGCLCGFEALRQKKRLGPRRFVKFWKAGEAEQPYHTDSNGSPAGAAKTTQEDWEMGHLYHARTFHATTPSPPLARWPFAWAWQALKLDDWFYATHCGMDNVVYVRFLRGCVWWILLQTFTTAPILLAIHFKFSKGVALNDMSRASLAYLVSIPVSGTCTSATSTSCERVKNVQGRKLLWIHLCLTWYITFTWFYTLWCIGKGSLRVRRRLVDKIWTDRKGTLAEMEQKRRKELEAMTLQDEQAGGPIMRSAQGISSDGDNSVGWRQRTLLVLNLPTTMRDEASIRRYFEEYLRPDDATVTDDGSVREVSSPRTSMAMAKGENRPLEDEAREHMQPIAERPGEGTDGAAGLESSEIDHPLSGSSPAAPRHYDPDSSRGPAPDMRPHRHLRSPVQNVVLVRKMGELSAMLTRRQEILQQLEAAHIKLATNVLERVGQKHRKHHRKQRKREQQPETEAGSPNSRVQSLFDSIRRKQPSDSTEDKDPEAATGEAHSTPLDELTARLARFYPDESGRFVPIQQPTKDEDGTENAGTVWEALADVPRALLDPYQPVTSLSALFRGQRVPTIDYLLTKLNLLTALIAEMKARPPSDYEPTSTAFVTFRDPRQARMVWRELKSQIVMKVRLAPEVKDLDWDRLMKTSFTGDLARGLGVNTFFWGFTVFWLIPLQLLTTALFSVEHLQQVIPGLAKFLSTRQQLADFISVTLPTVVVSLLTMSVPELVFQISKRAQGFVTWSALYDQCLCRYWKFLVCNIVIFFCIGVTTVEAILQQIGTNSGRGQILNNIAFAFPTAAPFFVAYLILALSLHSGFELLGFMVPILQHFLSANKATTPRARALRTLPRNFNRYYWLPFHILIMSIVFIFAILNPLVIPFALIYLFVAMIVFKKNFAFTYYRRFMEKEGVVYFIRLYRFTLDALTTAQVVILIFFAVTEQEKAYIALTALLLPITVGFKIIGTQLWKSQCRAVEDDEANAICGISSSSQALIGSEHQNYDDAPGREDTLEMRAPLDARAGGRYPTILPAPTTKSRALSVWQKVHDSFNANGADRPSYLQQRSADGKPVQHAAFTGARLLAKAPFAVAKKAHRDGKHIKQVAKISLGVDKALKAEAAQEKKQAAQELDEKSKTVEGRASIGQREQDRIAAAASEAWAKNRRTFSQKSAGGPGRTLGRKQSLASDEAPFLSGFEAIANHAPVRSEDGFGEDFRDGEESMAAVTLRGRRSSRSMRAAKGLERADSHRHRFSSLSETQETPYSVAVITGKDAPNGLSALRNIPSEHMQQQDASGDKPAAWARDEKYPVDSKSPAYAAEENLEGSDSEGSDYSGEDGPRVRPHARICWDDTPNNSARYNNPFYSCELDPFLWLPRDPLAPLNLCDTIEWHGAALVSSDGGTGRVGEWEEEDDEVAFDDDEGATNISRLGYLDGNEEIAIGSALAKRLEQEEEVEEVADPAASVPKNLMNDYKRAIRRESVSQGSQDGGLGLVTGDTLHRHASNMSTTSMRSPPASIREGVDEQFGRERPELPRWESRHSGLDVGEAPVPAPAAQGILATPQRPTTADEPAADTLAPVPATALGGTADRKTHFAPDPDATDHEHHRSPAGRSRIMGGMSTSTSAGSIGSLGRSGSARAASHHMGSPLQFHRRPQGVRLPTRDRRNQNMSTGAASIISNETNRGGLGRTITMRMALQAEVLEEERRLTLRDRLAAKKARAGSRRGRSLGSRRRRARKDDEEAQEGATGDEGEGADDLHALADAETSGDVDGNTGDSRGPGGRRRQYRRQASEIMARHERALEERRRRAFSVAASEGGTGWPGDASEFGIWRTAEQLGASDAGVSRGGSTVGRRSRVQRQLTSATDRVSRRLSRSRRGENSSAAVGRQPSERRPQAMTTQGEAQFTASPMAAAPKLLVTPAPSSRGGDQREVSGSSIIVHDDVGSRAASGSARPMGESANAATGAGEEVEMKDLADRSRAAAGVTEG